MYAVLSMLPRVDNAVIINGIDHKFLLVIDYALIFLEIF
jgi:hypothetical protein